jgi:hypothetical protein
MHVSPICKMRTLSSNILVWCVYARHVWHVGVFGVYLESASLIVCSWGMDFL